MAAIKAASLLRMRPRPGRDARPGLAGMPPKPCPEAPSRRVWQELGFESLEADRESLRCWRQGAPCRMAAVWWQPAFVGVAAVCLAAAMLSDRGLSALEVAVCMWAADLYTGCVHYVFDHFEPSELKTLGLSSLLGPLISSFHQHHADPSYIWRTSFFTSAAEILFSLLPQAALAAICSNLLPRLAPSLEERRPEGQRPPQLEAIVALMPAVGAWKAAWLIYGEFSHRQAHMPRHLRPRWVTLLQRLRLMLPPHVHRRHHESPCSTSADNNFCQIGLANPAVGLALRLGARSRWAWLVGMFLLTAFDNVLLSGAFVLCLRPGCVLTA